MRRQARQLKAAPTSAAQLRQVPGRAIPMRSPTGQPRAGASRRLQGRKVVEAQLGVDWQFLSGTWKRGINNVVELKVGGKTVVSSRQPSISQPASGTVVDLEARAAIQAILVAMREHGLIEGK